MPSQPAPDVTPLIPIEVTAPRSSAPSPASSAVTPEQPRSRPWWPYAAGALLLLGGGGFFATRKPAAGADKPMAASSVSPALVASTPVSAVPSSAQVPLGALAASASAAPLVAVLPVAAPLDPVAPPKSGGHATLSKDGPSAPVIPPPTPDVAPAAVTPPPVTPVEPAAAAVTPPPTVTPSAPAPVAPKPAFAPDHGRVRIGLASTSRIAKTSLQPLVGRIEFDSCYRATMRSLGRAEGGSGTVSLDIDEDGVISSASARLPGALVGASGCVVSKVRGQRLAHPPDTGSAGAVLSLTFEP